MKKIVLISCGSKKLDHPAPAKELYISPLFRLSYAYAESLHPDKIYILSAKHGLLKPETIVAPYNLRLSKIPSSQRQQWIKEVADQLNPADHYIILAGKSYYQALLPCLPNTEIPLGVLPLGRRLQKLKQLLHG